MNASMVLDSKEERATTAAACTPGFDTGTVLVEERFAPRPMEISKFNQIPHFSRTTL